MGCLPTARSLLQRSRCRRTIVALSLALESQHQPQWAMRLQRSNHSQSACPFSASTFLARCTEKVASADNSSAAFTSADLRKFTGEWTYQPPSCIDANIEGVSIVAWGVQANEGLKLSYTSCPTSSLTPQSPCVPSCALSSANTLHRSIKPPSAACRPQAAQRCYTPRV